MLTLPGRIGVVVFWWIIPALGEKQEDRNHPEA